MISWVEKPEPDIAPPQGLQWLRVLWRVAIMALVTLFLLLLYLAFYGLEKLFPRLGVTGLIIQLWCRLGLLMTGTRLELRGKHMLHGGALVVNHSSWQDIFTLGAAARISFVAKAEVRNWPGIGFLARITGTLFIERRQSHAKRHQQALLERLKRGDQLCFFPEGTSTDGLRVIKFRSTLFSVFHTREMIEHVWVQPATVTYFPEDGQPQDFYGWWGDMPFGPHVLAVMARARRGRVCVTFHPPVKASDYSCRKDLALYCERVVRAGLEADLGLTSTPA